MPQDGRRLAALVVDAPIKKSSGRPRLQAGEDSVSVHFRLPAKHDHRLCAEASRQRVNLADLIGADITGKPRGAVEAEHRPARPPHSPKVSRQPRRQTRPPRNRQQGPWVECSNLFSGGPSTPWPSLRT